jgi:hypothetical protein
MRLALLLPQARFLEEEVSMTVAQLGTKYANYW